jgi:hypothetical protein
MTEIERAKTAEFKRIEMMTDGTFLLLLIIGDMAVIWSTGFIASAAFLNMGITAGLLLQMIRRERGYDPR